ncbi:hypothetical protein WCLP8_3780006 [uncultured Gammaproteobacteria bacterium]
MAMDAVEIERLIKEGIPGCQVRIEDLRGDGNHYAATVSASAFHGKSRVAQHQIVYAALKGTVGYELHALALTTVPLEPVLVPEPAPEPAMAEPGGEG